MYQGFVLYTIEKDQNKKACFVRIKGENVCAQLYV